MHWFVLQELTTYPSMHRQQRSGGSLPLCSVTQWSCCHSNVDGGSWPSFNAWTNVCRKIQAEAQDHMSDRGQRQRRGTTSTYCSHGHVWVCCRLNEPTGSRNLTQQLLLLVLQVVLQHLCSDEVLAEDQKLRHRQEVMSPSIFKLIYERKKIKRSLGLRSWNDELEIREQKCFGEQFHE